ncbi:hypothetical protein DPX39_080050600 [Trypanosoma brucei equiperdum]|uniref:SMP-LTD domain-containing protein n=1 Tax=Trypanosoma brucei equiperdum TaxID=630700 RepID=A0A3L6L5M4_9TRYP|nr:hypothetical protein DPX39_080050600 [Trypanosoma brucei equiperdum]
MLQWEWPTSLCAERRELIRAAVERAIRNSMAEGSDGQIRGTVNVDELNLGSNPPEVTLSGIRMLAAERTVIMVKVRYTGDFFIRLSGLEVNLDMVGSGAEEADNNFALPFFCPFEMTLRDILIDGMVAIEILQELEENVQWGKCADVPVAPLATTVRSRKNTNGMHPPCRAGTPSTRHRSGYGVLLGGGGRGAMRLPGVLDSIDGSLSSVDMEGASEGHPRHSLRVRNVSPPFFDILSTKMLVKQRVVKMQLFGDPLKSFRVLSNFGSVQGADCKAEQTIRKLIKPAIEQLIEEGIIFNI